MFDSLQQKLADGLNKVSGKSRLNENNIKGALKEVRGALLEADVALPVVKDFIAKTRMRAMGTEVSKSLSPGQTFETSVPMARIRVLEIKSLTTGRATSA